MDIKALLSLDPKAYEAGLKKAEDSTRSFTSKMSGAFSGFAGSLATAFSVGAVMKFTDKVLDTNAKLVTLSKTAGVSAVDFQKLAVALKMSNAALNNDAAAEKMGKALEELTKKASEAPDDFKKFGISVRNADGSLKASKQLLLELADSYTKSGDKQQAFADITKLLADGAKDLLPLLEKGSAGIVKLGADAEKAGKIVRQDMVDSLSEAKAVIDDFQAKIGTTLTTWVGNVLVGVQTVIDKVNKAIAGDGNKELEKRAIKNILEGKSANEGDAFAAGDSTTGANALQRFMMTQNDDLVKREMARIKAAEEATIEQAREANTAAPITLGDGTKIDPSKGGGKYQDKKTGEWKDFNPDGASKFMNANGQWQEFDSASPERQSVVKDQNGNVVEFGKDSEGHITVKRKKDTSPAEGMKAKRGNAPAPEPGLFDSTFDPAVNSDLGVNDLSAPAQTAQPAVDLKPVVDELKDVKKALEGKFKVI
jgi:hypothetical protein